MTSPPAYSIGTGKRTLVLKTEGSDYPGPGTYDFSPYKKHNAPRCKIGTARRNSKGRSQTPGPGAYESPSKIMKRPPAFSIGIKTPIPTDDRSQTPGPGQYENRVDRSTNRRAPSYSITGRTRSLATEGDERSYSPGPGAYEHLSKIVGHRQPIAKIGTSKRERLYTAEDTPGPGTYLSTLEDMRTSKTGPAWGFGTSERLDRSMEMRMSPGPGAYTLNSSMDAGRGKGANIVSRRKDMSETQGTFSPGPSAYVPNLLKIKPRAPSVKIGNAKREIITKEQVNAPGPGAYDIPSNYDPTSRRSTSVRIGTEIRQSLNDSITMTPGPATYKIELSTNNGPRHFIIPKRKDVSQDQKDRNVPGPGQYTPNYNTVRMNRTFISIGTAVRDDSREYDTTPGPALYDIRGRLGGPKWGFGTDKKSRPTKKATEPGPGSYNIPPKFANLPKYALSGAAKNHRY